MAGPQEVVFTTKERTQSGQKKGRHARVLSIAVAKGGTSKTTTAGNLGAALAVRHGQRVLLVDMDPQADLTRLLGYDPSRLSRSLYTALQHCSSPTAKTGTEIRRAILPSKAGVFLLPGEDRLCLLDAEITPLQKGREVLKRVLDEVRPAYDLILIDTSPSLSRLSLSALAASDGILIPFVPEYLPAQAVSRLIKDIASLRRTGLLPDLQMTGIFLSRVKHTALHAQLIAQLRNETQTFFEGSIPIFSTSIAEAALIAEAQASLQSVLRAAPESPSAYSYEQLAGELLLTLSEVFPSP